MTRPVRLGMLTPSSNTALEPITSAMLAGVADVSAHFSRFKVTEIALSESALHQFDDSEILRAAELLAHAKVDVIAWNGTSASWLGFERDERLCERIAASTGIRARTTVLAYRDLFRRLEIARIGLVTPYRKDVQDKIIANWGAEGLQCVSERHLSLQDNFSFAEVPEAEVARLIEEVVREGCDAVAVVCTNMRGAGPAEVLEARLGVPVFDSIAVTLWACLVATGIDPARIEGWGSLFTNPDLARSTSPVEDVRGDVQRPQYS
ncbi:maleate cis-trans isomerase family protein [Bradyrhizobium canariense]|uniref:Maleate isomerase n=1 Tax=Bradyrhizobium canariense TaxID=255045 RepID=A0A1H1ZVR2_9BRAD|nr:aspartate/glutamate racemase family protein [Bradyrhizobium canariense]SDT37770.1 maleate isomerase [Bradyrhizobium canariense]